MQNFPRPGLPPNLHNANISSKYQYKYPHNTIHMYSGITSGRSRVFDGELLYTKILEVNLFAFAYRLFHRDFSPINWTKGQCPVDWREISMKQSVGKCKQINF